MSKRWRSYAPLLLALGIYLAFQLVLMRSVHIAQYDESIYLDVARNIRRTGLPLRSFGAEGFLLLDQTPLYPYLLGGLSAVFGDNVLWLRLVTTLVGAGTIVLAYVLGLRLRGPVAGLTAALLLAVNPFFLLYAFFVRMEVFMCFFLLLAVWLLWRWEETERRAFLAWAGVVVATAVLFKVVAVFFCAAAVVYGFWRAAGMRQRIVAALWLGAPTAVGIVLWLSMSLLEPERLALRIDRWTGAVGGNSPIVDPRLGVAAWPWLQTVGANVVSWGMAALFAAMLVYFLAVRRGKRPLVWLLLLYLALTLGTSLVMQLKEPRHVIGLIPVTAVAIGLMGDWDDWWARLSQRWWGQALAAGTAVIFLWFVSPLQFPAGQQTAADWWNPMLADRIFYSDARLTPMAEIGTYLAQASAPGEVITVVRQGPVVGYYADRPYLFLYTEPFDRNMSILQDSEFVVADSQEFWQQSPEETAQLWQYIAEHFVVDYVAGDGTAVYHRRN